jgi:hypothetical protein
MTSMDRRRLALATSAGVAATVALFQVGSASHQTPLSDQAATGLPAWSFQVHSTQDPYSGVMQAPAEPPTGTKYVAVEAEVINDSDQGLNFTPVEVRLRDAAGVEYRGGSAIGSEPMISPRNLNPGERSRGWVWFILPADISPIEIVYVAPAPQIRIPLPS